MAVEGSRLHREYRAVAPSVELSRRRSTSSRGLTPPEGDNAYLAMYGGRFRGATLRTWEWHMYLAEDVAAGLPMALSEVAVPRARPAFVDVDVVDTRKHDVQSVIDLAAELFVDALRTCVDGFDDRWDDKPVVIVCMAAEESSDEGLRARHKSLCVCVCGGCGAQTKLSDGHYVCDHCSLGWRRPEGEAQLDGALRRSEDGKWKSAGRGAPTATVQRRWKTGAHFRALNNLHVAEVVVDAAFDAEGGAPVTVNGEAVGVLWGVHRTTCEHAGCNAAPTRGAEGSAPRRCAAHALDGDALRPSTAVVVCVPWTATADASGLWPGVHDLRRRARARRPIASPGDALGVGRAAAVVVVALPTRVVTGPVLTPEQAQRVYDVCVARAPASRALGQRGPDWWLGALDLSPVKTGALRPLPCPKMVRCPGCDGDRKLASQCVGANTCNGSGKVVDDRTYLPVAALDARGRRHAWLLDLITPRPTDERHARVVKLTRQLALTSVRIDPEAAATSHFRDPAAVPRTQLRRGTRVDLMAKTLRREPPKSVQVDASRALFRQSRRGPAPKLVYSSRGGVGDRRMRYAVDMLHGVFRSCGVPQWSELHVLDLKQCGRSFVARVHGVGQHHCLNKRGTHASSTVYFTIRATGGVRQQCFCKKNGCATFKSDPIADPEELRVQLFGGAGLSSGRVSMLQRAQLASGRRVQSAKQIDQRARKRAAAASLERTVDTAERVLVTSFERTVTASTKRRRRPRHTKLSEFTDARMKALERRLDNRGWGTRCLPRIAEILEDANRGADCAALAAATAARAACAARTAACTGP